MEDNVPLPSKIQSQKISFNHAPKELLNIAQNNPKGFTVDLEGNHITKGFAVARMETQNSFEATGAEEVLKFATQNNCYIGGWLDMKSGQ